MVYGCFFLYIFHKVIGRSWDSKHSQKMYVEPADIWVDKMLIHSKIFAARGRANSAIVKLMRACIPLIQKGDFTQNQFELATKPTGLIEGLEHKFGKVKATGALKGDSFRKQFVLINQAFEAGNKNWHSDQIIYEKATNAGLVDFDAGLRVKFLSYQKVRDNVFPFFTWFKR